MHRGFYYAYHNTTLRPAILNAVKRAKECYGDIPIMVTGHSMGGAMAAFCGLDLKVIINKTPFNWDFFGVWFRGWFFFLIILVQSITIALRFFTNAE